jgi:hypothetical protein
MSFQKRTFTFNSMELPSWEDWQFFCRFTYDKLEELKKSERKIKRLQNKLRKAQEK